MQLDNELEGILVISLEQAVAAPYCGLLLADASARVIKVEPPGGDDARQVGPFTGDMSAYFLSLNCGKESIAVGRAHFLGWNFLSEITNIADDLHPGEVIHTSANSVDMLYRQAFIPKILHAMSDPKPYGFQHSSIHIRTLMG